MACSSVTLAGIALGCKDNVGGLELVYINRKDSVEGVTMEADVATAIALASDAAKFQTYKVRKESCSLTSTYNQDEAAGTASWTTEIALQFSKLETAKRIEIQALAEDELVAIVKDNNGKYWLIGKDHGLTATAGTAVTGQAFTDLQGYTLTLSTTEASLPVEVAADAIASIIA